jgi:tRNA modification GTPase
MKEPTNATFQTPPGKGGIAVVALSGPRAGEVLAGVFRPVRAHGDDAEGVLRLGRLVQDGRVIDEAIVCRRGGRYEINIHGGPAVALAVMDSLVQHGARAAPADVLAPEFRREHPAWNNPGVGEELLESLPQARSELVVTALARQWSGGISELARRFLGREGSMAGAGRTVERLLEAGVAGHAKMHRLLHPAEVVLAGPPNVGKSSLANALIGRAVSIVHEQPGTTRDWVREPALLDGVPVWLTDTAGIWAPPGEGFPGEVGREAIRRALERVRHADVVLLLDDGTQGLGSLGFGGGGLGSLGFGGEGLESLGFGGGASGPAIVLRVATKCDLGIPQGTYHARVSAHTGEGLRELRSALRGAIGLGDFDPKAAMAFTSRQSARLVEAAEALKEGAESAMNEALTELLEGGKDRS